ncbi:MAG: DUF2281 domain-containing protein [Candidatus Pseudobacter hemicellulosilyticus]|uniref:DUF2281 domain-containing protein n=1 Tax=Candidatus Pseudobacter hemicellulosilyticus TaxID=3121375 RepID=A0AAJ5WUX4_9BACT|nr:MAG: DUF2281 domain-containing protein [Pseudobacter sp.]
MKNFESVTKNRKPQPKGKYSGKKSSKTTMPVRTAPRQQKSSSAGKRTFFFGCCKGKIIMAPNFDDPIEDFKEYM